MLPSLRSMDMRKVKRIPNRAPYCTSPPDIRTSNHPHFPGPAAKRQTHHTISILSCQMAGATGMKASAELLLNLNFIMHVILVSIGGWAMNKAINHHGPFIGPESELPANFSAIQFPMGNHATGFFVMFALLAGATGAGAADCGYRHKGPLKWDFDSLPSVVSTACIAWVFTLLALGFGCKEMELQGRNASLRTMEAFLIILAITQPLYVATMFLGTLAD